MTIADKLTDLRADLSECRRAITYRGGEISATAGFKEVAEKIASLPASSSVGTVIDDDVSSIKLVPINSTKYCYLKLLGGMTYKDEENKVLIDSKPTALKVHGSNLIDIDVALKAMKLTNYTKDGDNYTIKTGLKAGEDNPYKFTDYPQICTISVESSSNQNYVTPRFELGYLDDNGTFTRNPENLVFGSTTKTVKSTIRVNAIRTSFSDVSGSPYTVTFSKLRINYGTVDCGYQPYHEPTTYAIPEELQGTGRGIDKTYHDSIDFEIGNKRIKVGKIVYNGTETWVLNSSSGGFFTQNQNYPSSMATNAPCLCSHFSGMKGPNRPPFPSVTCKNSTLTVENTVWFQTYSTTDERGFATVTEWTDFLKEQAALGTPVTVYYVLGEAVVTDIDTSEFDPLIEVEAGGSIEFITDSGKAPNSTVIYQTIV